MMPESSMDSAAGKDDGLDANKCSLNKKKAGVQQSRNALEDDEDFVIDFDHNGGVTDVGGTSGAGKEEKMCRICHLNTDYFSQTGDLIQLGCRCKNDLGSAHRSCAELWFAMKGSRYCEICGAVATNVSDVVDNGFILERNDAPRTSHSYVLVERRSRPVCTFVAAIIIMALAISWLFDIKPHHDNAT